jgi:hypothetical protein
MIEYMKLPENIISNINFIDLYKLRPDTKSSIILYDKDENEFRNREIFRSYMSYLKTPEFNPEIKKSYMFLNKTENIPKELEFIFSHVKSLDSRYNQMVVNWYDTDEYIEAHRDCVSNFINKNSPILMVNLNESDDMYNIRSFNMISIENNKMESVPLLNGFIYKITNNDTHRHFTGRGFEKRISITFRMMK